MTITITIAIATPTTVTITAIPTSKILAAPASPRQATPKPKLRGDQRSVKPALSPTKKANKRATDLQKQALRRF
jgi:hypothetical protein